MPQAPSTRWCPTPEQLMILEEMYRSGVRTPNASQIQQITAHLSYYGKIEGKNVFYWFQNHKARDRQKLRRRLSRHNPLLHPLHPLHFHALEEAPHPPPHLHHHSPPHFPHKDATAHGMNLLSKLEGGGRDEAAATGMGEAYAYEWMAMADDSSSAFPPCCRPPKTLDLFPTRSTGLKDECSTSSCSTSTNN